MRSVKLCFDWTVFKKTICRFWPLWGAYFAIWLVMLPLHGLMLLRLDQANRDVYGGSFMYSFAYEGVPNAATGRCLALVVVVGVLAAMAVFSHLCNARSANLFGSLPIRREGLFLTHYLAGLAFLVVPNVVIFLLTLLVELAGGSVCWQGLLFWLAVSCGEGFFFYSMAVFCAMFTGHILALPVFYGVFNGLVIGVTTLVDIVFRAFYYGFSGFGEEVYEAVEWFTPIGQLGESVQSSSYWLQDSGLDDLLTDGGRVLETHGLGTVGIYAIAALALTVCAFFLYRARRLESAGDVVSVRVMRPVFKYGVALCSGAAFGIGTVLFIGGGEISLMIAIVIWGVIGYFAAQMLLDKSFRVFRRWKGAVAVAGVFVVLFLVVGFDLTGFETRIPDPAGVDSVNVYGINAVYLDDDGDHLVMDIDDPEIIGLVSILHREAVAQRDEERQTQAQLGGVSVSLDLKYALRGGGSLKRRYSVWLNPREVDQEGTAAWAVQQIYDNHSLYWQVYGFANMEKALAREGYLLERAGHRDYDEETGSYTEAAFYGRDASALLAAVKEDFFAGRIGVRRVDDGDLWYAKESGNALTFRAVGPEDGSGYRGDYYVSITLQDTASSTLAALEEMAGRAVTSDDAYQDGYGGGYSVTYG